MGHEFADTILQEKAELLNQVLKGNYFGTHNKYRITVSVGIAQYPKQGLSFNTLCQLAEESLLEAKKKGKDCYKIYNEDMRLIQKKGSFT